MWRPVPAGGRCRRPTQLLSSRTPYRPSGPTREMQEAIDGLRNRAVRASCNSSRRSSGRSASRRAHRPRRAPTSTTRRTRACAKARAPRLRKALLPRQGGPGSTLRAGRLAEVRAASLYIPPAKRRWRRKSPPIPRPQSSRTASTPSTSGPARAIEPRTIVFNGVLDYRPNTDAALLSSTRCLPAARQASDAPSLSDAAGPRS